MLKSKARPARKRGRPKGFTPAPAAKAPITAKRLLYDRRQAGYVLGGLSVSSIIRLERQGLLTPIKLLPSKTRNTQTFYRVDEIEALTSVRASRDG